MDDDITKQFWNDVWRILVLTMQIIALPVLGWLILLWFGILQ